MSWWRPDVHEDRRPRLHVRNAITRAFRRWFEARDFVEVETAALQVSPGNETHLHAFETEIVGPAGRRAALYLQTSPEFACKKLLAAGERRIFNLARVWRNRERGPCTTLSSRWLEWYRAEEPYEALMDDCAALIALAAETAGAKAFEFRGRVCDPVRRAGADHGGRGVRSLRRRRPDGDHLRSRRDRPRRTGARGRAAGIRVRP
ncbi:MAG: amino acid--tRNA ligase-related protein [Caulobacteraceae bacterium]